MVAFECTGREGSSFMIPEDVEKRLAKGGYNVTVVYRDSPVPT